jgi:hypothetical protein
MAILKSQQSCSEKKYSTKKESYPQSFLIPKPFPRLQYLRFFPRFCGKLIIFRVVFCLNFVPHFQTPRLFSHKGEAFASSPLFFKEGMMKQSTKSLFHPG